MSRIYVCISIAVLAMRLAQADCLQFSALPWDSLPGISNYQGVTAMVSWTPPGATEPVLVVSGPQRQPVGLRVCTWDGESFSPLGGQFNGPVSALVVFRGELYAVGSFTSIDGVPSRSVVRWDGSAWFSVGGHGTDDGFVGCACVWNDMLVVGGQFTILDAAPCRSVAAWDGVAWTRLGDELRDDYVTALADWNGELYAAGYFRVGAGSGIARWNGAAWQSIDNDVEAYADSLLPTPDALLIGGRVLYRNLHNVGGVKRWDGSTLTTLVSFGGSWYVLAMTIWHDRLVAVGTFQEFYGGAGPARRIAVADANGSWWRGVAPGLDRRAYAAAEFGGDLYIGGDFNTAAGVSAPRLVRASLAPPTTDLNGDGLLDLSDLAVLLANFGTPSGASHGQGDLDGDGAVALPDLAVLLREFGTCTGSGA